MSKFEKIKKMTLIAVGFALATYLIMSAMAILNQDSTGEGNAGSEVHTHTVQ